jgi:hypothetical protein
MPLTLTVGWLLTVKVTGIDRERFNTLAWPLPEAEIEIVPL